MVAFFIGISICQLDLSCIPEKKKKKKRSNAEVGEDRRGRTTQNIKVKVNVGKIERGERRIIWTLLFISHWIKSCPVV